MKKRLCLSNLLIKQNTKKIYVKNKYSISLIFNYFNIKHQAKLLRIKTYSTTLYMFIKSSI